MDFDRTALDDLVASIGPDPDDLIDLISTFLEDAPDLVAALAAASSDEDAPVALRAAHTLKSGARDFGAVRLAPLCETIEKRLRAGARLPEVSDLLDEVARVWPPFREALQREMQALEARS
jgi:HPt (histidine-containing phosphotransfer) domain-containing protein